MMRCNHMESPYFFQLVHIILHFVCIKFEFVVFQQHKAVRSMALNTEYSVNYAKECQLFLEFIT